MDLGSLAATDLNLLVALHALLDAGGVTAAARRVGVTQPAMSRSLARLRELFGDPLLVRSGRGMVRTPLAIELGPPLAQLLERVATLLEPDGPFDPRAPRRFRVAMVDYAGAVVLPNLARSLAADAPGVALDVRPLAEWDAVASALARGTLDAAIGFEHDVPASLERRELLRDRFVCVVRRGHPRVGKRLTLRRYVELPHVLVSSRGPVTGVADVALARRGLARTIAVTVPHFMVAPQVVRRGNAIATLAERIATLAPAGLRLFEPPLEIPGFTLMLAWHGAQGASVARTWLRERIAATVIP